MSKNFWEQNAKQWGQVIEAGVFKSRQVTNAAIIHEIQRYGFKTVLDVGCGEGWIGGALDSATTDYLGIDGSQALIEIARTKHQARFQSVTYEQIATRAWKATTKFAGVIFNFSLLEEDLTGLLRESSHFLQAGGRMLIQTLHPCFALPEYRNGWNHEDFKSSGIQFSGEMRWYGRTLGAWTQLFEQCGLAIEEIVEPMNEGKPASIIFVLRLKND